MSTVTRHDLKMAPKLPLKLEVPAPQDIKLQLTFVADGFADASAIFYKIVVNYEGDSTEYVGKVVNATISRVIVKNDPRKYITIIASFTSEYQGPGFRQHFLDDESYQYCQENFADITKPGARIVLTVHYLGQFANQVVSDLDGMQFIVIVSPPYSVDETWCDRLVQASVTSSKPSPYGMVMKCAFVQFLEKKQTSSPEMKQAINPADFPALAPNIRPFHTVAEAGKSVSPSSTASQSMLPPALASTPQSLLPPSQGPPPLVSIHDLMPALRPRATPTQSVQLSELMASMGIGTTASRSASSTSPVPAPVTPAPTPQLPIGAPATAPIKSPLSDLISAHAYGRPLPSIHEAFPTVDLASAAEGSTQAETAETFTYPIGAFDQLDFNDDPANRYTNGTDVYRAWMRNTLTGTMRPVAVKLFKHNRVPAQSVKSLVETMQAELLALENLTSQHVVKYIACMNIRYPDVDRWGKNYVAIVMEQEQFLLDEYLKSLYSLSDMEYLIKIKPLIRQLIQAYIEIHRAKIIHRDVKPENILVSVGHSGEAIIKVCDFGFCKSKGIQGKDSSHLSAVRGNTYLGTVYRGCWIAPEVLLCTSNLPGAVQNSYTVEADIWPLGLVVYYMAARGYSPIRLEEDTRAACRDPVARWNFLTSTKRDSAGADTGWSLHTTYPVLFDLIELMVRPFDHSQSDQDRISLEIAAAHPFFWDTTITARIIVELVDEINSRTHIRQAFLVELNRECAPLLPHGWNIADPIFNNLDTTKGNYDTKHASFLLKAVRDVLCHERSRTQASQSAFISNHHYKQCIVEGFLQNYSMILCRLFRTTLSTHLIAGRAVRKYGTWTAASQHNFKFTFY